MRRFLVASWTVALRAAWLLADGGAVSPARFPPVGRAGLRLSKESGVRYNLAHLDVPKCDHVRKHRRDPLAHGLGGVL
jgi:hypothetical protein